MKATQEKDATYVAEQIRQRLPNADVKLHVPSGKGKVWWIDVTLNEHLVTIEWSKEDGFGLSTPAEDDYGSATNEVYTDADETAGAVDIDSAPPASRMCSKASDARARATAGARRARTEPR